ncbi:site-specific integrase [Kaistia terrae]|uniref:Site-specific integrase n=1 Tax=Kaistia terrae TaxID=537017 RepID=A0ABW0PZY1_9HYPH|nr:site-specific integrase [Kaistia terrae]MCX5580265.1 tyrosine-type recombinase/integrase [Kaistia terrae]
MVLQMARPWRDPDSGIFYLRKRVPRALLPQVKGTTAMLPVGDEHVAVRVGDITKASLRTREPSEAKTRYTAASAALSAHLQAVVAGPMRLSRRQVVAIAGTVYNDNLEELSNEPGEVGIWRHALRLHAEARAKGKLEQWVGPQVDLELAKLHIVAHPESRTALIEEIDRALVQRGELMKRFSEGDFRPDPEAARFPDPGAALAPLRSPAPTPPGSASANPASLGLNILDVWAKFKATITPASSTVRRWEPAIKAFDAFIESRGMETVTPGDATLFADHRVAAGISATSASKVDLAAVKRMFTFAHKRSWLKANPLAGLRRERRGTEEDRDREGRDFHPPECRTILNTTRTIYAEPGGRGDALLNTIRWVPWICAYSGVRPGEAIQLRKEDFSSEDGIPFFHVRGSAGTVKTGKGRRTPIHRCLVAEGLLDFVRNAKAGHLFVNVTGNDADAIRRGIDTSRGRLGEWVRAIGVNDPEISPSHSWRHTFKAIALDGGMTEKVADAICGHAQATQGRKYGTVSLATKAAALEAFPEYALEAPTAAAPKDAPGRL